MSNVAISLINTGTERSTMAVSINGHTKDGKPVVITRKGIETLRSVIEMGNNFNATPDRVEQSLAARLKGLPNGEDVFAYLCTHQTSVTDYVNNASQTLVSSAKIKEPTGRAKRGEGYKVRQTKLAIATLAKLTCLFTKASTDGSVSQEMLSQGLVDALETIKNLDDAAILKEATEFVTKHGVDEDGHIKFRSQAAKEE